MTTAHHSPNVHAARTLRIRLVFIVLGWTAIAEASTLARVDLEYLVAENDAIAVLLI
ncbi:MAG TPA: hypothetical protein VND45_14710 [Thermoanaerobaculia bacterium]|jgi:hypothetical protein|nr:hypothetical protein [Thermoanaerobaculia bacterium]